MSLEPARRQLEDLASISKELNETTDAFTEELKAVEAQLGRLALGVEVTLPEPLIKSALDDVREVGRYWDAPYLAYGRWNRLWKLKIQTFRHALGSDDELLEEKPLLEAPRDLRMLAAPKLEPLLALIGVQAKKKLDELRRVVAQPRNQTESTDPQVLECIADLFGRAEFMVTRQGGRESTSKLMKAANVKTANELVEYLIRLDGEGLLERNQRYALSFRGRLSPFVWTEILGRPES